MSIKNREVKAEEIERYVRSKINYSFNKEVFENQLTE